MNGRRDIAITDGSLSPPTQYWRRYFHRSVDAGGGLAFLAKRITTWRVAMASCRARPPRASGAKGIICRRNGRENFKKPFANGFRLFPSFERTFAPRVRSVSGPAAASKSETAMNPKKLWTPMNEAPRAASSPDAFANHVGDFETVQLRDVGLKSNHHENPYTRFYSPALAFVAGFCLQATPGEIFNALMVVGCGCLFLLDYGPHRRVFHHQSRRRAAAVTLDSVSLDRGRKATHADSGDSLEESLALSYSSN